MRDGSRGERHHGLSERSVRRREDHREEERLAERQVGESATPAAEPGDERQREPEAEKPDGNRQLTAKRAEVDARGVREQDDGQRRLGELLDALAQDGELEEAERLRADDQAERDEDHRRGDGCAVEPPATAA